MTEPAADQTPHAPSLNHRRIAFVGKLGSMTRKEAREAVRSFGCVVVDKLDDSVNLLVLGADQLPFEEDARWLDELLLQDERRDPIEVITEGQFCKQLGLVSPSFANKGLYTPAMLADLLQLPLATIRRWHRRGLIRPIQQIKKLPYFDFQEIATARRIAQLINSGASPQAIESKLSRVAQLYPHLQRPLSQLSIIVEGKDLLLRNDGGLVEPSGQMRLDFDADAAQESNHAASISFVDFQQGELKASANNGTDRQHDLGHPTSEKSPVGRRLDGGQSSELSATPTSRPPQRDREQGSSTTFHTEQSQFTTPQEFLELAIELEDAGDFTSAIDVYRSKSLAFGPSADTSFRIAELLYQQHDIAAARERYYVAIELDETLVEARASLGCVLMELNQPELAYSAFSGALLHHPDYPDVHFHMARLLDELDQPLESEQHWRRFLALAPQSPWAAEAQERLHPTPSS